MDRHALVGRKAQLVCNGTVKIRYQTNRTGSGQRILARHQRTNACLADHPAIQDDLHAMPRYQTANPVGRYSPNVTARRPVPFATFRRARYLLATDGWVAAGATANLLSLGSVVLRPASDWSMYFDEARMLRPFVHYVPLWEEGPFDVVQRLAWLERSPQIAATIARNGEALACRVLGPGGRRATWRALLRRYAAECAYAVDADLVARRLRLGGAAVQAPGEPAHVVLLNFTLQRRHGHAEAPCVGPADGSVRDVAFGPIPAHVNGASRLCLD